MERPLMKTSKRPWYMRRRYRPVIGAGAILLAALISAAHSFLADEPPGPAPINFRPVQQQVLNVATGVQPDGHGHPKVASESFGRGGSTKRPQQQASTTLRPPRIDSAAAPAVKEPGHAVTTAAPQAPEARPGANTATTNGDCSPAFAGSNVGDINVACPR